MKPVDVLLVGAGENGRVIRNILASRFRVLGYLDDSTTGPEILGPIYHWRRYRRGCRFFITIGDNRARQRIFQMLAGENGRFVNAIHAAAMVEPDVVIGRNIFVGACSYVNVGTRLRSASFINNGCIIEHDNIIGPYAHVAPGVVTGGRVVIGQRTFVGLGSRINDHLSIGRDVTVGSGSVVITDVPAGVTVVGIPARALSRKPRLS